MREARVHPLRELAWCLRSFSLHFLARLGSDALDRSLSSRGVCSGESASESGSAYWQLVLGRSQ